MKASELELFKAVTSSPDEQLTQNGLRIVLDKRKQLPKKKVRAKDHSVLGPMLQDIDDHASQSDVAARQRRKKQGLVPDNGHHGGEPADELPVSWGIGQPQRPATTTVTVPNRAPPHDSYFRNPPSQPQSRNAGMKLSMGTGDDLRKQAGVFRRIRDAGPIGTGEEPLDTLDKLLG